MQPLHVEGACIRARAAALLLACIGVGAQAADWNGDAIDTPLLYGAGTGEVRLLDASGNTLHVSVCVAGAHAYAAQSLAGDWNGDGADSCGTYEPGSATVRLRDSFTAGPPDAMYTLGPAGRGWSALAGDWDGDGADTVALYDPAGGVFHIANMPGVGAVATAFVFGPVNAGWTPIGGDWDGDGIDTVGLYDPLSSRFHLTNSPVGGAAAIAVFFGPGGYGWLPVAGDWNGDGIDTVGLFDPVAGAFHLSNSHAGATDIAFAVGLSGDDWVPVGTPLRFNSALADATQWRLLQLINAVRAQGVDCGSAGVFPPAPPLIWNDLLAVAAQYHAADMATGDFFSHTGSDGSDVAVRAAATGYDWLGVGENLAAGFADVDEAHAALIASPGHCANLMQAFYEEFGSAVAHNPAAKYRVYWAQVFAAPR